MSWFNSGLHTLKDQLASFAQEVLTEAEKGEEEEERNPINELEECKRQKKELILQCSAKDIEITALRKQISQLEKNSSLENSWICELDNPLESSGRNDNEGNSESSSGGVEMITVPLADANLLSETGSWEKIYKNAEEKDQKLRKLLQENTNLEEKIIQLTACNQELTENLETLDCQHNVAIQELLELKNELQNKLVILNTEYELSKQQHEKDLENLKTKLEDRYEKEIESLHVSLKKFEEQSINLKKTCEAKDVSILQFLSKTKEYEVDLKKNEEEFNKKIADYKIEIAYLKEQLEKKQDGKFQDSSGSISKQGSEDGFIVLQNESYNQEDWEKKCKDVEQEKIEMEEKVNALEEDFTKLKNEIYYLIKENENLKWQLHTQKTENLENNSVLVKRNKKITSLQNLIEDLVREKNNLQEKVGFLLNEYKESTNELDIVELETRLSDIKRINENLRKEIEVQKSTISNLTDTIVKCEANASDVESKLVMENVDLHQKIIDMESSSNENQVETITVDSNASSSYGQLQNLLSTYLNIKIDLRDLDSLTEALISIQSENSKIDNLKENLKQMNDEISNLKTQNLLLEHEKQALQADVIHYEEECEELMKNNEILLSELENIKRNKLGTISENDEDSLVILEKQLEECNNVNKVLEEEYNGFKQRIEELEAEKQDLLFQIQNLQYVSETLEKTIKSLKDEIVILEEDNCRLIFEINEMKTDDKKSAMEFEINDFKSINENLEMQLERLSKDHSDLVAKMQSQKTAYLESKKEHELIVTNLNKQLKDKENHNKELLNEIESLQSKMQSGSVDEIQKLNNDIFELKHQAENIQTAKEELEIEYKQIQQEKNKIADDIQKQTESKLEESHQIIERLSIEKNDLMQTLAAKHNENVQYYNEIQRLDQLLKSQSIAKVNCENCSRLQGQISDIVTSKKQEIEKLTDQINFLKEKCDILTKNMLTEQTNQKLLQQEKTELVEQNNNLKKDLERLRQHLIDLQGSHTQETIEMQNIIDETKFKMAELQNEIANSSNAYTSASIRANQQIETLQAQNHLISQQRDELAIKLSKAEDRESKNQAAIINLQCALEQFQKEKIKDIELATNRIQKELKNKQEKQKELENEIDLLNQQLAEANHGLLAATRLSNQLEISQMKISSLKEQISKLESVNQSLNERLHILESNQNDKIEKNLVKSLIIGYIVSTNDNDKAQILKIISSILNFDQIEINKVGLNRSQSGWLSNLLHGSSETTHQSSDGLVKAFVEFLEKESQPRNSSLNLLNVVSNTNNERKISTSRMSTSLSSATISDSHYTKPILVNESVLEQFAPTRNSSSILKDILNDT